jgi:hypothetical protein
VCKKVLVKRATESRPQFALRQCCSIACKHLNQFVSKGTHRCPSCLKTFVPKESSTVFCSHKCFCKGTRIEIADKRCLNCGEKISRHVEGKKSRCTKDFDKRQFCSRRCAGEAKYKLIDKRCEYCGKNMFRDAPDEARNFRRKRFCNRKCIARYAADKRYGDKIYKECVYCGRELTRKKVGKHEIDETPACLAVRKFCGSRCWGLWKNYKAQQKKRALAAAKQSASVQEDSARWDATVQAKRNKWKLDLQNNVISAELHSEECETEAATG